MSVALLRAQEFGAFAARVVRYGLGDLPGIVERLEGASAGNAGAFAAQYGDIEEPASAEEIERWALDYLSGRHELDTAHWGPITYNCIANDGRAFLAVGVEVKQVDWDSLRELEEVVRKRDEAQHRERVRAEEDAASFDDIARLPRVSADEIEAMRKAAGAERVIFAEFRVNESDSQSDYWGGRTARRVVIGFGKGKRESFRQLRKAAGAFPPTAEYGPKCDVFTARVVLLDDVRECNGSSYWKGEHSHWHQDIEPESDFTTLQEAEAFIASAPDPGTLSFSESGVTARFGWEIGHTSLEHRENYSMGGGNYLGRSRYDGWKVSSQAGAWSGSETVEYWEGSPVKAAPVKPVVQSPVDLAEVESFAWL